MMWMLRNQLGQRNMNDYQRSEMVLKLKPIMAVEAEKRMLHADSHQKGGLV